MTSTSSVCDGALVTRTIPHSNRQVASSSSSPHGAQNALPMAGNRIHALMTGWMASIVFRKD